jgi:hypothetical protein
VEAGLPRQVQVAVVQARDDARLLQVEDARSAFREGQDLAVGPRRQHAAVADCDCADVAAGLGGDTGVVKDEVGCAGLGPCAHVGRGAKAGSNTAGQEMTAANHDGSLWRRRSQERQPSPVCGRTPWNADLCLCSPPIARWS